MGTPISIIDVHNVGVLFFKKSKPKIAEKSEEKIMMQFKTVALPATVLTGVKGKDLYTVATANKALAPIAQAIEAEAKGGWSLHSYVIAPATIIRKKGILEIIFGWIPVIGIFFRSKDPDVITPEYYMLIFQREA